MARKNILPMKTRNPIKEGEEKLIFFSFFFFNSFFRSIPFIEIRIVAYERTSIKIKGNLKRTIRRVNERKKKSNNTKKYPKFCDQHLSTKRKKEII